MITLPDSRWCGPRPEPDGSAMTWTVGRPDFLSDDFDPRRRASPWAGHRPFAYDLVVNLRPRRIVELGTHYGCSLFAFCQAVADAELSTELIAVDTWQGDPHAGHYDDVYELVDGWVTAHFPDLDVRLVRSTFDDAIESVEPASVDLLHIDGYHTFEAVRHDHESWVDRLTARGTVLFHDIDPASGYGSADYWRELSEELGGYTFLHSFGLGVLTRDRDLAALLASDDFGTIARYYTAIALADLRSMQVEDTERLVGAKQSIIDQQDQLIRDRDEAIESQTRLVEGKQAIIDHQDELIRDRDAAIESQAQLVDAKQAIIDHQRHLLALHEQLAAG